MVFLFLGTDFQRLHAKCRYEVFYGDLETAPLIRECPINLECKMTHSLDFGSHCLVVGEMIEAHVDEDCLTDGKPDPERIDPLIFLPAETLIISKAPPFRRCACYMQFGGLALRSRSLAIFATGSLRSLDRVTSRMHNIERCDVTRVDVRLNR